MKTMKKVLALLLALTLLLAFTACGDKTDKGKGDTSGKTQKPTASTGQATGTESGDSTAPSEGDDTTGTTQPTDDSGLLPDDGEDGSKERPFEIGGVLEFDAAVKAGGVIYYDVYRVGGTDLRIESKDATVEYKGKVYEPKNGVITFPVTTDDINNPVKLAIGNKGGTDAIFKVTFTYPAGTKSNPLELEEGDLVAVLKQGDEDGLFYLYTATEAGTLTVVDKAVTKGVSYDISLFNLTNSAIRTLEEDGVVKDGVKMVSIEVGKGDRVEVVVAVLPDNKNEYPSATIKSQVAFAKNSGSTGEDEPKEATYTVTVKDSDGATLSGVKLQFAVGDKTASVTTDSKGVAKATLLAAEGTVTITVPGGYIAEKFTYGISSAAPQLTIVLTKELPSVPDVPDEPDQPDLPDEPVVTTMDYTVTLLDGKGNPMGGLTVSFYNGDKQIAEQMGDKKGVSKVTLERGTYTVKVEGTDLKYDAKAAVVSTNNASLTLVLAADLDTSKSLKINDPLKDKDVKMYYAPVGAAYVTLTAGERNYVLFEPAEAGTYRFDVSNAYAKLGHFGTDMFVYIENSAKMTGNTFTISVSEGQVGNVFVIGLDAATNCTAAVLRITRIGDPAWSIEDEPTIEYKGNGAPKPVTAPSDLTDLDIFSSDEHHFVYNEKDGYYHLDSANGPVVYVRMNNRYASIAGLLAEFGNMTAYLYNSDGTFKSKEQYAPLMQQYVNNMDKSQQVYPLTQDLKYMLDNYGESQNWWNEGEPGYLFGEVEGVNPANAWMFLFCYKK